jgi:hypothetical protein
MRRLEFWGVACVLGVIVVQGWFATTLNHLYYERYAPFFDSMSYWSTMADVLGATKGEGVKAGLTAAFRPNTVSLPWVITALLGKWLPYSRDVAIWMQETWMALLAVSVLAYWRVYRGAPMGLALHWTIPVIAFAAVFRANGGISDFRMDLSLYIFFSLVMCWYLASYETRSRLPWVLSGGAIALCCWNRATSPVYLAVSLGPLLVARWWSEPESRGWLVRRMAMFWISGAVLGLLPIARNWNYIHYYYFVWGADPNAHLSLSQSATHAVLAGLNFGYPLAFAGALALGFHLARGITGVDWRMVWMACSPVLMLMWQGAGLNPFVTMPAVFGAAMFCVWPHRGAIVPSLGLWLVSAGLVAACGASAYSGYKDHLAEYARPSSLAIRDSIRRIEQDCNARGLVSAEFITSHLADFQAFALTNVLIYDLDAIPEGDGYRLPGGLHLKSELTGLFSPAVLISWQGVPGANDEEKVAYLSKVANETVDYFFLPDAASIDSMEKDRAYNYINLKIRGVKRAVLSQGRWTMVGSPIRVSAIETVELYRNEGRR